MSPVVFGDRLGQAVPERTPAALRAAAHFGRGHLPLRRHVRARTGRRHPRQNAPQPAARRRLPRIHLHP